MNVKHALRTARAVPAFLAGLAAFRGRRQTPAFSVPAMRELHSATGGRLTAALASAVRRSHAAGASAPADGVLGTIDPDRARTMADAIRRDGFYVFEERLDVDLCEELERFARARPAVPAPAPNGDPRPRLYERDAPVATRYDFDEATLMTSEIIQRLAVDRSLRAVAQAYLGAEPVNDLVAMWWTIAHGGPSAEAAQLFHSDLDRVAWLKFFIYLTDVDSTTGPHVFVRGSHRSRPRRFQQLRRFQDEEVASAFPQEEWRELCGPRGTIMAVDTIGLHKGKHPSVGERLLLQVEYATTLFGAPYTALSGRGLAPDVAAEVAAAPRTFERFDADDRAATTA